MRLLQWMRRLFIRLYLFLLGVKLPEYKLDYQSVFVDRGFVLKPHDAVVIIRGCIALAYMIRLRCIETMSLEEIAKLKVGKPAYQYLLDSLSAIIREFASKERLHYDEVFEMVLNPGKRNRYLDDKVKPMLNEITDSLVRDHAVVKRVKTSSSLVKGTQPHNDFLKWADEGAKLATELKAVSTDMSSLLKKPFYCPNRKAILTHIRSFYHIVKSRGKVEESYFEDNYYKDLLTRLQEAALHFYNDEESK